MDIAVNVHISNGANLHRESSLVPHAPCPGAYSMRGRMMVAWRSTDLEMGSYGVRIRLS